MKTILFLGVEVDLFTSCFGNESLWKALGCQFQSLPEPCNLAAAAEALGNKDLQCVVIEDHENEVWDLVKGYYDKGGFVVYFGIMGEFSAPSAIGGEIGADWSFSAYTTHNYLLTPVAFNYIGDAIRKQQYSKCNLVAAPEGERLMVPEVMTLEEFFEENASDDDDEEEVAKAKASYEEFREAQLRQSPLVLHRNEKGGRFAYLGFVNGDGKIPNIRQALLTDTPANASV